MIDDLLKLTPRPAAMDAGASGLSGAEGRKRGAEAPKGAGAQVAEDFQKLYDAHLGNLVQVTSHSDRMDRAFAAGKTDNIHEVMVAASHSSLAVETAMQIRNIAVRAFQTLTQLR